MHAVIDTSVLVYDTVEDSEKHSDAEELLESLDGWLIPSLVLYEYVWFFKRQGIEGVRLRGLLRGTSRIPCAEFSRTTEPILKRLSR